MGLCQEVLEIHSLLQGSSSSWSAHRTRSEFDIQFDAIKSFKEGRPVLLTREMVFSWLFDEIQALKPFKDVSHLLAKKKDWPPLYDISTLKNNKRFLVEHCEVSASSSRVRIYAE